MKHLKNTLNQNKMDNNFTPTHRIGKTLCYFLSNGQPKNVFPYPYQDEDHPDREYYKIPKGTEVQVTKYNYASYVKFKDSTGTEFIVYCIDFPKWLDGQPIFEPLDDPDGLVGQLKELDKEILNMQTKRLRILAAIRNRIEPDPKLRMVPPKKHL